MGDSRLHWQRATGIGVLVIATVMLFGISVVGLPSSLGLIAALLLPIATLLIGISNEGRSV